jgi:hypothetical protein
MVRFVPHPTPNPNSLKITTDAGPFTEDAFAAFNAPDPAENHPLGKHLMAIPGVASILIVPQFVTVTKQPAADWDVLYANIERALAAYYEEQESTD